ncbi:MAG: hypothetical protein OQK12_08300, partial [Motiliproteus sp.]|nr:hypothetical protein [Motiliproteus sp.]
IIIRGLGMSHDQVFADELPKQQLEKQSKITKVDIEDLYDRRVKRIFSAVIAFISRADFTWKEKQSGDFHWLRDANSRIVEAIKATKHLQKNMLHYLISDNHHIRHEYNRLRIRVAELLRELETLRVNGNSDVALLSLDELKLEFKEFERAQSRRLFQLIREDAITPEMGTSLMNDSGYLSDITNSLLAMATTLFVSQRKELTGVERKIALDDKELEEVLDQ